MDPLVTVNGNGTLVANQSDPNITCVATGTGAIDPIMKWQVNGEDVQDHKTHSWKVRMMD